MPLSMEEYFKIPCVLVLFHTSHLGLLGSVFLYSCTVASLPRVPSMTEALVVLSVGCQKISKDSLSLISFSSEEPPSLSSHPLTWDRSHLVSDRADMTAQPSEGPLSSRAARGWLRPFSRLPGSSLLPLLSPASSPSPPQR